MEIVSRILLTHPPHSCLGTMISLSHIKEEGHLESIGQFAYYLHN